MVFFHEQSGFIRNYRMGALVACHFPATSFPEFEAVE